MESLNLLLLHLLLLIVIVICSCCCCSSTFTYNTLVSIGWSVPFIANQSDLHDLRPTGPSARYLQSPAMLIYVLLRFYLKLKTLRPSYYHYHCPCRCCCRHRFILHYYSYFFLTYMFSFFRMPVVSPHVKTEGHVNPDSQRKTITVCVLLDSWAATASTVRGTDDCLLWQ